MFRVILVPLVAGFLGGAVFGVNINKPIVTDDPRAFIAAKIKDFDKVRGGKSVEREALSCRP